MRCRIFIVSILLLAATSANPRPLTAQINEPANGQDARTAPKAITPRARNTSSKSDESGAKPSSVGSVWTTFGSLAVVIFLILIIGRSWKKHGPAIGGQIPAEAVELLGRKHLDARQTLHLVRLGSRILLLGSSAGGLRTLAEVDDPVDVDFLAGVCRQPTSDGTVAQTFRALFNRRSAEEIAREQNSAAADRPNSKPSRGKGDASRFHRPDMEEARG